MKRAALVLILAASLLAQSPTGLPSLGGSGASGTSTAGIPISYHTSGSVAASCPATTTTIGSYTFPAAANISAGDVIHITSWWTRSAGASTILIDTLLAGQSVYDRGNNGPDNLAASQSYATAADITIVSSSSLASRYSGASAGTTGGIFDKGGLFTGLTISATPTILLQASGCSSTDTVQLLGYSITLTKAVSL